MPKRRGREKLIDNLSRLSDDLLQAKAEVEQMKSQLSDGLVELHSVSVCYHDLSGHVEDFFEDMEAFKQESLPQEQTTTAAAASLSSSASSSYLEITSDSQPGQSTPSPVKEYNMDEILQRLGNLETESVSVKSDNNKLLEHVREVDDSLGPLHRDNKIILNQLDAMSFAVFGKETAQPSLDLPTVCQKLKTLQAETKSCQSKLDKEISGRKTMAKEETESLKKCIAGLHDELAAMNHQVDRNTDAAHLLEGQTKQTMSSVLDIGTRMTRINTKVETFTSKADELVKLRKILNHVHLEMQKKLDLETRVQCLEQETKTVKITMGQEMKTVRSEVKMVQNNLKGNIDMFKKNIKDAVQEQKTQVQLLKQETKTLKSSMQQEMNSLKSDVQNRLKQNSDNTRKSIWDGAKENEAKIDQLSKRVDNIEKSGKEQVYFKAKVDTTDEVIIELSVLNETMDKAIDIGKGLCSNARFRAPVNGHYSVALNLHQNGAGDLSLGVLCNGEGTSSGLAATTHGDGERDSSTSILKLSEGDELSILVMHVMGEVSIGCCVLHGYLIHCD